VSLRAQCLRLMTQADAGSSHPGSSQAARETARRLADRLCEIDRRLTVIYGADLRPAVEQQLFFTLRAGEPAPRGADLRRRAQAIALRAAAWAPLPRPRSGRRLVVVARQPAHLQALGLIDQELASLGESRILAMRPPFGKRGAAPPGLPAPPLIRYFDGSLLGELMALLRVAEERRAEIVEAWGSIVGPRLAGSLATELGGWLFRVGSGAMALTSVIRHHRPDLLGCFDEIGTWARVLPAVGRAHGIPTVDLPHAEAADPVAIAGAGYDHMAVYGQRARSVLVAAGIAPQRIATIGAPLFDPVVRRGPAVRAANPPRVIFAAQYVTGSMSPDILALTFRAAAAAARAVDGQLIVRPHPVEPAGQIESLVAAHRAGFPTVKVEKRNGLNELLDSAWLLVTGWSNSVFEAAIRSVPSIAVSPAGVDPMRFGVDGLALRAETEAQAIDAARALREPAHRAAVVGRARGALAKRIGPLDGRSSERAARLLLSIASGSGGA
jgi:hypothetical protein